MNLVSFNLVFLAGLFSSGALGQEPILIIDGEGPYNRLAYGGFDFAGDINGDGYDDIVTSALDWQNFEKSFFQVHSGVDGSQLHSWRFGVDGDIAVAWSCSSAGDMDGDGLADVVLGGTTGIDGFIGGEDFVEVRSGGTGKVIQRWAKVRPLIFGTVVRGGGDVNGDGVPDVIAREYDSSWGSRVNVYSGATGKEIYVLTRSSNPTDWSWSFGWSLDFCGDVNLDGFDDFIVGDIDSSLGNVRAGAAFVFSGVDGSLLFQFAGSQSYSEYGKSVAGPGDVNGDGVPDLVVGAPDFDGVADRSGMVFVFSGVDGAPIFQLEGEQTWGSLGTLVSQLGDVNSDGFADLLVCGGKAPNSDLYCRVFSGLDHSVLTAAKGGGWQGFGDAIAGGGDINGDGFPDFAVSASEINFHAGRLYVYPGNPVLEVPHLVAGQHVDLEARYLVEDLHTVLAVSLAGTGLTLVPRLDLSLDLLEPAQVASAIRADAQGKRKWHILVPPGTTGITLWLQAAQYRHKTNVVLRVIQ